MNIISFTLIWVRDAKLQHVHLILTELFVSGCVMLPMERRSETKIKQHGIRVPILHLSISVYLVIISAPHLVTECFEDTQQQIF